MTVKSVDRCKVPPQKTPIFWHNFFEENDARHDSCRRGSRSIDIVWIVIGCVWALARSVIAMLPIRRQIVPDALLIVAVPVLICCLIYPLGWLVVGLALFAFLSMFRTHMIYLAHRLEGQRPEIPQ